MCKMCYERLKNKSGGMKCFRVVATGSKKIITKYISAFNKELAEELFVLSDEELKSLGSFRYNKVVEVNPTTHRKLKEPVGTDYIPRARTGKTTRH